MNGSMSASPPPPITKTSRLPRFRRVSAPPGMVLTDRDREILRQVYQYRMMTREHVEHLLFSPENGQDHFTRTSKVRERLKLLFQHAYLERIPVPVRPGTWAWQPVYRLGRKGAKMLAAELGITVGKLAYWGRGDDRDHRATEVSALFIRHTLAINTVRVAITRAAAAAGYRVETWLDDATLKQAEMRDYVMVTALPGALARKAVIPDAYFVLHLGERRAHFLLELDRATMTNRRWKTRVLAYREYVRSGKYQERYGTRSLRILTVTTTPERLENLRATTAKAGGKDLFWFTTLSEVTPESVLSAPIWRLASDEPARARKILIE